MSKGIKFTASEAFHRHVRACPLSLVDVGARGGIHPRWSPFGASLRVYGFEPDSEECRRLNAVSRSRPGAPQETYFPVALSDRRGQVDIHILRSPGAFSVYAPNTSLLRRFPEADRFEEVKRATVPTDRLDHILESHQIVDVDFLKIDAQGAELSILKGAEAVVSRSVFGVEVEVEFVPMYMGQPLFSEVDAYLRSKGFRLFDLNRHWWKNACGDGVRSRGQMIFADALYLKDLIQTQEILPGPNASDPLGKALKTLGICEVYGYCDFALELLSFYRDQRLIAEDLYGALYPYFYSRPRRVFRFRGRKRLGKVLGRISGRLLDDVSNRWFGSDSGSCGFRGET